MVAIGGILAVQGSATLIRVRRSGIIRVFGRHVASESLFRHQALVAIVVLITVSGFLTLLLGAGIWLAMSGPK
jgi:hypothetical protein